MREQCSSLTEHLQYNVYVYLHGLGVSVARIIEYDCAHCCALAIYIHGTSSPALLYMPFMCKSKNVF